MTNGQVYKRFAIVTVLTMIAIFAITYVLEPLFGLEAGGAAGIVSLIVPAMDAGGTYVRKTGELLEKRRMWRMSAVFFLINFVIGLVATVAILIIGEADFVALFAAFGFPGLLIILAGFAVVCILIARFFLGLGGRQTLKLLEK